MGPLGAGGFREYLSQLGLGEAPAALPGLGTGYDDNGVPLPSGQSPYMAQLGTAPTMQSAGAQVPVNTPVGQAILPGVAHGVADAVMAPGRAYTGEMAVRDPETGALSQEATDWGAGTALGMLGGSSVPRAPIAGPGEVALGMFAGRTAMPAHLRRLVYDHGLLAVREGQAFAGENLDKLTGFLAKRRARRQAEALKVSISLL